MPQSNQGGIERSTIALRYRPQRGRNRTKVGLKECGWVLCGKHGVRRNRTKVGLKDPTFWVWCYVVARRNRTKVGLKACQGCVFEGLGPCRNRTKVGLKACRPCTSRTGKRGRNRTKVGLKECCQGTQSLRPTQPQSNQGGIESWVTTCRTLAVSSAAIEPRWD